MIPKIIHYCWFGGKPLPPLAVKCIKSWEVFFPDYEIKEWNESNFDIAAISYTKEAYDAKKYAFVSDYARFFILYKYGGLYFDTDVEVIKPMNELLEHGSFMGCEVDGNDNQITSAIACAPGLALGCEANLPIYKELLSLYEGLHFLQEDGSLNLKTVVSYTTELLVKHGLKNIKGIQKVADLTIYPEEYFCPKSLATGRITITPNTYSIHHYDASWQSNMAKFKRYIYVYIANNALLYKLYRRVNKKNFTELK